MRYAAIILLALCVQFAFADLRVQIVDAVTGEPVAGATVRSDGFESVSDAHGMIQLPDSGTVVLQHPGYFSMSFSAPARMNLGVRASNPLIPTIRFSPRIYVTDEYTVTSTRFHTLREDIPQAVTDVSPKTMAFHNPQTSADALGSTGQVFVQKSQLGGGSPMLRGFAANSVLMVVDGVRMNNAIFRSGNLQNIIQVDPNSLDRATVLFGPGSVQFGSDALGGVMNFETPDPVPTMSEKLSVSGAAYARTATANFEKTSHANVVLSRGRVASYTSLTYSDFDDLRTGSVRGDYPDFGLRNEYVRRENGEDVVVKNDNQNVQTPSGYSQFNALQKFAWQPSSKLRLGYGLYWTTSSNIPRYDRLIEYRNGALRDGEWYYGPQEWLMNVLSARVSGSKIFDNADIALAYQKQEESRNDRRFGSDKRTSRTENVDVASLNADFEKSLTAKQRFFYGLEAVHNRVESSADAKDIVTGEFFNASTRYPDGGSKLTSAAAYAGHQWKLNAPITVTTGLRYSWMTLNSRFEDTTFYKFPFDEIDLDANSLTGSLGAAWSPDTQLRVYAGFSSGFRAPNVDDVGKLFDSEPGNVVVPNPGLGPEYSYNVEAGAEKRFGNAFTLGGSAYYTWIEDVMVRRDFRFNGQDSILYDGTMSRVQAIVNAGYGYVTGFDINARATFTRELALRTTLTYTAGRDLEDDVPLRHIPPVFGETRLTYEQPKWIAEFFARYNLDKPFDELPPEEQAKTHMYTADGTPGWYTLNLRGTYRVHHILEVQAALENILDHHYRPYASGISAPGRNLIIALRTQF